MRQARPMPTAGYRF